MHKSLKITDHRPWPLPPGSWTWRQAWKEVLFAHYPVPKEILRPLVPGSLLLQEFDGKCWVGIVPFKMEDVMLRPFPNIPGISSFLEINVRVYVEFNERPGVFFLSLDANNALAVWGGRLFFHLPYKHANIKFHREGGEILFQSIRKEGEDDSSFSAAYGPDSEIFLAKPGTFEHFLTERYCLYAQGTNGLYRANVHHQPWPLQKANAKVISNSMLHKFSIELPNNDPLLLYSKGVDVIVWDLEKLSS